MKSTVYVFHDLSNPKWVESTLRFLKRKYQIVGLREFTDDLESIKKSKGVCHLSVDDGNKSVYSVLYPVLQELQIEASLFVSPRKCEYNEAFWFQEVDRMDKKLVLDVVNDYFNTSIKFKNKIQVKAIFKSLKLIDINAIITKYNQKHGENSLKGLLVSSNELKEMNASGLIEIGAHTINHPILKNESNNDAAIEINDSILGLQKLVNQSIYAFAYPNGIKGVDFDDREIEYLKNAGIEIAFSFDKSCLKSTHNRYSIPRIGLSPSGISTRTKIQLGDSWEFLRFQLVKNNELKYRSLYPNSFFYH